jgi:hypothetical protein
MTTFQSDGVYGPVHKQRRRALLDIVDYDWQRDTLGDDSPWREFFLLFSCNLKRRY